MSYAPCVFLVQHKCPTSSYTDAGDVMASHLPKWKDLRKVEVQYMNSVPILLSARSCGKLHEVVIEDPEHCTVGCFTLVTSIYFTHYVWSKLGVGDVQSSTINLLVSFVEGKDSSLFPAIFSSPCSIGPDTFMCWALSLLFIKCL